MGVDINTYRCRVGMFVPGDGCGFMSLFITFGRVVKCLGSLTLVRILLLRAGVEQNPGPSDEYIFRYQYLLVEIGTDVLRKIFDVKVGSDFVRHLSANNNKFNRILQRLISAKIITADQAQHLPPIDNSPKLTNFDITLLTCLLRNICGLRGNTPNDPVWKNPSPADFSLEADLARLKECRNNLQHSGTVFMSKTSLNVKWNDLSQILNRLNIVSKIQNLSTSINDAEKMDIDKQLKQRYDQAIKAWTDMDNLCDRGIEELKLGQSEIKTGQSEISQGQSDIKHGQSEIKDGQSQIKDGQSEIIQGQSQIKEGQSAIKDGQSEIIQGQSEIKDGQSQIKDGQSEIIQGQSQIKDGLTEIIQDQSDMKDGQSEIKDGQSELKVGQVKIIQGQSIINDGQAELKDGQAVLRTGQSEIKLNLKELSGCKTSMEHVERSLQEQAENMQEFSNTQKRLLEQTPLECKRRRLDMDESDLKRHLLETYNRDCCTLPVSPLYNEEEEDFFQIYQPPTMDQVDYHRAEDSQRAKRTEESNRISSYKDIFFKNEQYFQNIYVTGDAGVGKTSLCKCLCLLWCKSQSGGTMDDKEIQNDINFLARFEFLFYISLRDTDCRDVVSMIVDQFYDSDSTEQHSIFENVLRQHKCLVILDAFDEWTPRARGKKECKIPFRVHSENTVYLTTCRPYKIENVRLSRRDIDQHVRVSGIHGTSSKAFVVQVVNHMNTENGVNKNAKDFMREVKQCGLYEQLCIPMVSPHLVVVWFSQKLTDMSKAVLYGKNLELLFKRAKERNIEFPASSPCELQLPGILSELRYLKEHVPLLHKICLLSFRSLFKQDEDVFSLVFTSHQLMSEPYLLSGEEMNFLCKIGILSKNKVIGCFEERKQKLSFLHKSYIEFFAAVFVSSFDADNVLDNVAKEWTSVGDVVQFQNFFILLAGFSYEKVKFLFDSIYLTITDDLIVHRINAIFHHDYYPFRKQIKLLQTTLTNCWKENDRRCNLNTVLQIQDFIFECRNFERTFIV